MRARVLIVDDHPSFRSIARRLLVDGGFAVVGEAADGAGAISAARELHPDVVLLDVQLPDLDGFAVAAVLAAQPAPPAVVLVSSRSRADYGTRVGDSPAVGFIAKAELSGDAVGRLLRCAG
ncbi:response regulator transcription factor [Pseudonocardia lacus]|uniref:response regulator transcription factor n=1 Tax=Pseudonocardia lacus TaxID=2835865 RepID=UPI001BDC5916|nr:response regulator transcription factor [Pseudonocardia lacus]